MIWPLGHHVTFSMEGSSMQVWLPWPRWLRREDGAAAAREDHGEAAAAREDHGEAAAAREEKARVARATASGNALDLVSHPL